MFTAKYFLNDRVADYLKDKNKEDEAAAARLESAFQSAKIFFADFPLLVETEKGHGSVTFTVYDLHESGNVRFCYNPVADKWWYATPHKVSQNFGCLEESFKDFLQMSTDSTLKHISEILNERSRQDQTRT
jgi:hypothetical protein